MSIKSNNQGRAYEFACLNALQEAIAAVRPSEINHNSSYDAAQRAWHTLSSAEKALYTLSARSITDTIFALEPNIIENSDTPLHLYLQEDQRGIVADVRDIIIERKDITWEIGLSVKHNHAAVKHSRLSAHLDFGEKWYDIPCSTEYWTAIAPIFTYLDGEKRKSTRWRQLPAKETDIYIPILNAFRSEILRQTHSHPAIPRRLVEYLLSKYDFYKVISIDSKRLTTIQSFNIHGSLNTPGRTTRPSITVPHLTLPTRILYFDFQADSTNTLILCLDGGWQFTFRIHNASSRVEPSLKFDIQIVGMPAEINMKFNCKWNDTL